MVLMAASCQSRKEAYTSVAPVSDSTYIAAGNAITKLTFDTLRGALLHAIATHGIEGAIPFCHENALDLTTQFADSVSVKRAALRYRNKVNTPDSLEAAILAKMEVEKTRTGTVSSLLTKSADGRQIHFFKPIMLQAMCLNCHGEPGRHIQPATMAHLKEIYPDDAAVNYQEGDLRGAWHITFYYYQP